MGYGGKGKGKSSKGAGKASKTKGAGKGSSPALKGKGKGKADSKPQGINTIKDIPTGLALTAQFSDGLWYPAKVMQVRAKAPQIKVRYDGYTPADDLWCTLDELKSKQLKGLKADAEERPPLRGGGKASGELPPVGAKVKVTGADGVAVPAEVVQVSMSKVRSKAPVKVRMDVWVSMDALGGGGAAPAKGKADAGATELKAGTKLQAMFLDDGKYYPAEVLAIRKKAPQVKVTYKGYDSVADAWLGYDQIRGKGVPKPAKAAAEAPKSSAKAAAKGTAKAKAKSAPEPKSKAKAKAKVKAKAKASKGKGKGRGN